MYDIYKIANICHVFSPFGKDDDSASPLSSRVRSSFIRLHPRRLGSAAASSFATIGSTGQVSMQAVFNFRTGFQISTNGFDKTYASAVLKNEYFTD